MNVEPVDTEGQYVYQEGQYTYYFKELIYEVAYVGKPKI